MKKWLIGLACAGLFATAAMGQLVISQYTETESGTTPKGVEIWNSSASDITFDAGSNLLDVKIGVNGAAPASAITVNSGTLVAGDVLVIGTADMAPDVVQAFTFNGDDALVLELGGVVQDVFGDPGTGDPGTGWAGNGVQTYNQNIQLIDGITTGDTDGWTDPSTRFELVSATPSTDLTGFGIAPGGTAPFEVTFDPADGFEVGEGVGGSVTATAANGTGPYGYSWSSTLDGAHYTTNGNVFTIGTTAPLGNYSATVVATDSSDPVQTVSNTVNFSVVEPLPEGTYIVDFEGEGETKSSYASATVNLSGMDWDMTDALIGTTIDDWKNGLRAARMRGYGTSSMTMLADLTNGLGTISFDYRRYGTASQVVWRVEYSANGGASWTQIGADFTAPDSDDVQAFSETVDVGGNVRVRIKRATETGAVNAQLNIDDIEMSPGGPAGFGVTFDKLNGFVVEEGTGDAITATASAGTEPYGYSWSSTLGGAYYATNDAVFTILATAPAGDYSATVVATDADPKSVTNMINFSVKTPYAISIVTNGTGTVTTLPAGQAVEGSSVAITATPGANYLLESLAVTDAGLNPVDVSNGAFTMPAAAAIVTATFVYHEPSALIISEVADPGDNASGGRFVELYNAGGVEIDLAAGTWYLARQANAGSFANIALTGTVAPGSTYVIAGSTNYPTVYPAAPAANQTSGSIDGNGNDGYYLYSGGRNTNGILEDAYGVVGQDGTGTEWDYLDSRAARNSGIVQGNPAWTAAEWTITDPANVADMTPGVHPDGPVSFSVSFDQTSGFEVEENTTDVIVATAANGTAPYSYSWTSTLVEDYRTAVSNEFTILATAPIGDYSATVVATDSSEPVQSVTNTLNFSVVAAPIYYSITINPTTNGTATTTPETQATADTTVTVNPSPAGGYVVESITVTDTALNPVGMVGNTFTMPSADVIVTVTFVEGSASGALIISQYYEGASFDKWIEIYNPGASAVDLDAGGYRLGIWANAIREDWKSGAAPGGSIALTGTLAAGGTYLVSHTSASNPPYATADAQSGTVCNFTGDDSLVLYTGETYSFANVVDAFGMITNQTPNTSYVRASTVTAGVNTDFNAADWVQFTYAEVDAAAESTNERLGYHSTGAPVLSVSLNKANGFTVNQGSSDTITATATNGTPEYGYSWGTTLPSGFSSVGAVFTIEATAPAGNWSATVTATDATLATAQRTVTFTVVAVNPDDPAVLISGSLSGTVGVQMSLAVSLTNGTATDWFIDLVDPDALADTTYGFDGSTFTLTPTKTGTYVLTITAVTETGNVSNTVNLVISGGGGELPNITEFEVPAGATASATLATTTVGKTYKLQYTTNLLAVPVVWQDADTQAGTGGEITLQDGDPADMARYYRVTEN